MNPKRLLVWLWIAVSLAACQYQPPFFGLTPTPSITLTPSITPSPIPSPTPSPTPTPIPSVRVSQADRALFNGDYETARREYQLVLADTVDEQIRAAALWGLGHIEYDDKRYDVALSIYQQLINDYPNSPHFAQAYFLLGQTYLVLERYQETADALAMYISLRPDLIDAYVQELRGDAFYAARDYANALAAYNAALQAPHLDDAIQLQIKIAQAHATSGNYTDALVIYDSIASTSTNDNTKAQMDLLTGQAYIALGQIDNGYQRYMHAVENYPKAYDSYSALVELINAKYPVNDLDRGLVDYFAGKYDVTLLVLDRYIAANPENDGTAHYYRALALHALGYYAEEIEEWSLFIANYPSHRYWADAWDEKASTQWYYLDNYVIAAQTLLDFVQSVPTHPEAADFLMEAGRVLERSGRLEDAAQVWRRVADEYPASGQASQALFWAGIARYRTQDLTQALSDFQRSLILADKPEDQARASLWIGKLQQKLGDLTATQNAWQQAQALDPTGYYSVRARDLLTGLAPFASPLIYNPNIDITAERDEAAAWVRLTFNLPADTDLSELGALRQDPRLKRGTELWELGLLDQARTEFESLREAVSENPADSFRLANYLVDLGMYRTGIFAAREVLTLAGLDEHAASLKVSAYFNHVRYGQYYADLIVLAAQNNDFHPLFLYSIVRQESLFEGFVHSTAGARGLMQIMPSTGASIAGSMDWPPNFDADDLYRPIVSINLGTHYLAYNRDAFNGNIYAALAAYNAGPGNAVIWKGLAGDDPDLLLEVIRFEETRQYIRYIYEIYSIYRALYNPTA
jgi:soluble lytic murein transglycosylase